MKPPRPPHGPAAHEAEQPDLDRLLARFEERRPPTVGLEEELMLLRPDTLELVPAALAVLERVGRDRGIKLEMPASQVENVTPPRATIAEAIADLARGRRRLLEQAGDLARFAAAGVHPFAAVEGELNPGEPNRQMADEYGSIAHRQLVCALQVHVAVGGRERTLAVYNALRGHLPEIAALAAAAPWHAGLDSGLASVRPTISQMLPRQGVPPALASWEAFADGLRWGAAAGTVPVPRRWWWELRPNVAFGTLEVRVPDAQATLADVAAVGAFVHALVVWLAERVDGGERLPVPETWRIGENRWSACRHGVEGTLADLVTGARATTRERLTELLEAIGPTGARLGCERELADVRRLIGENGAMRQRAIGRAEGAVGVARWLSERFADGLAGDGPRAPAPPGAGVERPAPGMRTQ